MNTGEYKRTYPVASSMLWMLTFAEAPPRSAKKVKSIDDLDDYTKEELKDVIRLQELFIENLKKQKALAKKK